MHILSVNDNELNFKVLEQTIYKIVCEVACEVMKDILERIDLMLLARRDTKKYRNKG
ncbi:MAG TPA: ISLre2 family transposase, partial [Clostridiales bacterium]|nr:ISLre2 family transposase [Clostridiales bacterium]